MKSDCCGAETCDHCNDCGSYDIRPKCNKCEEFCDVTECKPAEPREKKLCICAEHVEQCNGSEDCKQEHPGRWPVNYDALPGYPSDEQVQATRDYIIQLEARAEAAEKERDEQKKIRIKYQDIE